MQILAETVINKGIKAIINYEYKCCHPKSIYLYKKSLMKEYVVLESSLAGEDTPAQRVSELKKVV